MHRMLLLLAAIGIAAASPAAAGTYYRYETERSVAFTDKLENVPSRYRDTAVAIESQTLLDYERTTVSEQATPPAPRPVEGAIAGVTPRPQALASVIAVPDTVSVEIGGGVSISTDEAHDEPLRVEHDVFRWEDGRYTRFTIIRRGDKILAEIRESSGI